MKDYLWRLLQHACVAALVITIGFGAPLPAAVVGVFAAMGAMATAYVLIAIVLGEDYPKPKP